MKKVWNIIEKERISGYEHRAPKSNKKTPNQSPLIKPFSGCLININDMNNITLNEPEKCNINETDKFGNPIIKINTGSST